MLDGYKNYIFAASLIVAGILAYFFPEMNISVLGAEDPSTLVSTGLAWALGRNALKKLES